MKQTVEIVFVVAAAVCFAVKAYNRPSTQPAPPDYFAGGFLCLTIALAVALFVP